MVPKNERIGAGWKKEYEGKKSISIKLNNGLWANIYPNERKEVGSKQPDYNVVMRYEDAESMGLISEYTLKKMVEAETSATSSTPPGEDQEANIDDIPF